MFSDREVVAAGEDDAGIAEEQALLLTNRHILFQGLLLTEQEWNCRKLEKGLYKALKELINFPLQ